MEESKKNNGKLFEVLNNNNELKDIYYQLSEQMQYKIKDSYEFYEELLNERKEHKNKFKIYNLIELEQIAYIKKYTTALEGIDLKGIKQIETDYYNNVYVVLNDGYLLKNGEILDIEIDRIWVLDGLSLYMITNDDVIVPLDEDTRPGLNFYLNNNYYKYKKIIDDEFEIVALTYEGDVRFVYNNPMGIGILPENLKNVDDIIVDDDELSIPYIIKQGKKEPLFLH